jgi:hypothetical protein
LHLRTIKKKIPAAFVLLFAGALLLSCGGGSVNNESLTLVPSTFNITVNTQTGAVTGATPIQAFLNKTPVALSTIAWTSSSTTVPSTCIGVDQTGVPHCNSGCGSMFSGVVTATISSTTVPTTASATINCQFQ